MSSWPSGGPARGQSVLFLEQLIKSIPQPLPLPSGSLTFQGQQVPPLIAPGQGTRQLQTASMSASLEIIQISQSTWSPWNLANSTLLATSYGNLLFPCFHVLCGPVWQLYSFGAGCHKKFCISFIPVPVCCVLTSKEPTILPNILSLYTTKS